MPRYEMAGLEPVTEPFDVVAERYEQSDRFVTDAGDWLVTNAYRYPELIGMALELYRNSPEFATVVDDICDGCDEL